MSNTCSGIWHSVECCDCHDGWSRSVVVVHNVGLVLAECRSDVCLDSLLDSRLEIAIHCEMCEHTSCATVPSATHDRCSGGEAVCALICTGSVCFGVVMCAEAARLVLAVWYFCLLALWRFVRNLFVLLLLAVLVLLACILLCGLLCRGRLLWRLCVTGSVIVNLLRR